MREGREEERKNEKREGTKKKRQLGNGEEERQKVSYLVIHTTWPAEQREKRR